MAFRANNLHRVAGSGANSIWLYHDQDNDGTLAVDTAGYFAGDCPAMMRVGDLVIRVSASAWNTTTNLPTTIGTAGFHVVMVNSGTSVNVSDTTALTVTNTD
jgi:hypothetical protein